MLVVPRLAPALPAVLVVLVAAIVASAAFGLRHHGVDVVGHIPAAYPRPAWPDVTWGQLGRAARRGVGVLLVSTEAVGVGRAMATEHGYRVDPNRDLVAMGAGNLLAGLSSGFVQSGGASQTAAADRAGGQSQLSCVIAAVLVIASGIFLAPLFEDLPQAALGAIVVVSIAGFYKVAELRRFAHLRHGAIAPRWSRSSVCSCSACSPGSSSRPACR